MSEARKKAQKKAAGASPRPPGPPLPSSEPEEQQGGWVSREETLVFPAEPPAEKGEAIQPSAKISLPSSGLAEDILARAEAAAVGAVALERAAPSAARAAPEAVPAPAPTHEDLASKAHNISFFAAPTRDEKKAVEATEHLVTFYLADEEYGVDVRLVQEIIRVTDITQVPRAPEFIKGVINLRGRIIPVVDLKKRLNLGEVEFTRQARIVVVKVRDRLMGLLVDGASQVLKVPVSSIEPPPEEVVEIDANYIRGVAKLDKRLIILVDLQKILVPEREGAALVPA